MAKTISFNYDGHDYVLEFTRATIEKMEKRGFVLEEVYDKPMTNIPRLFRGAFEAHHPKVSRTVIDSIFENLGNRYELIKVLTEMYSEPLETLMEGDKDEGKLEWKMG